MDLVNYDVFNELKKGKKMKFELMLLIRELRKLLAAIRDRVTNGRTGAVIHWLIRFLIYFE